MNDKTNNIQDFEIKPFSNFKLPIEYVKHNELSSHILNDLEFLSPVDKKNNPIYNIVFKPKNIPWKTMFRTMVQTIHNRKGFFN